MRLYCYGLSYNDDLRQIELPCRGCFPIPDRAYTPDFMCQILRRYLNVEKSYLDADMIVSLNARRIPSGIYKSQYGAQVGGQFDLRLLALYSLLSFREHFVYVHYYPISSGIAPSEQDDRMCRMLSTVYDALSAELIDFLLMNKTGYYSYMEAGQLRISQERKDNPCEADAIKIAA